MDENQILTKGKRPLQVKVKATLYHQKRDLLVGAVKFFGLFTLLILISG